METKKDIINDPWLNDTRDKVSLPDDLTFVCAWELDVVLDNIEEAAFYRRTDTTEELWISSGFDLPCLREIPAENLTIQRVESEGGLRTGCVFAVPREDGDELQSCLNLLHRLFRAYVGFCSTKEFIAAGIVEKSTFNDLVERLNSNLKENAEKARQMKTEIVEVAEELKLHPRPTGTGPDYWWASCPGTNHHLYIGATSNSFGCGWCKRKGGPEDLRAFVNERRKYKQVNQTQ